MRKRLKGLNFVAERRRAFIMEIKGFVIGEDLYGDLKIKTVKMNATKMPSEEDIEVPGITNLKLVSLNGYEKRKIVDSLEWVGDIDSCKADEIISRIGQYNDRGYLTRLV
jgi:hypothetical protein